MKNRQLVCLLLLTWSFSFTRAETEPPPSESDLFASELTGLATSNQIYDQKLLLNYRNHRRDLLWPYPGEAAKADDFGAGLEAHLGDNLATHYNGVKAYGTAARKFSEHFLAETSLGFHNLASLAATSDRLIPFVEVAASFAPKESIGILLRLNNDFVYQDFIQPGATTDFIVAQSAFLNATLTLHERIRMLVRASLRNFSDDNVRRHIDVSFMYGISPGTPWIWAGLGGEFLSYPSARATYWSPQKFYSFGPRFESVFPISEMFSGTVAVNLNRFAQDSFDPSYGFYATTKLTYGNREALNASFGYTHIHAQQNSGVWFSDGLSVTLNTPF